MLGRQHPHRTTWRVAISHSAFAVGAALLAYSVQAESLEQAWDAALNDNPQLAASQRLREAAEAYRDAAHDLNLPTLELSASRLRLDPAPITRIDTSTFGQSLAGTPLAGVAPLLPSSVNMPLSDRDVTVGNLRLQYPLYSGGRISAAARAGDEGVRVADANASLKRQDVKLAVAEDYLNVLRADAALLVAQRYRDSLRAHEADIADLEKQGMSAKVERLTADAALSEAERHVIDAQSATELSRAAYNRQLGRPLDAPVQLELPPEQSDPDASDPAWMEQALLKRGELTALAAGQTALHEQARAVRGEQLPQIALEATHLEWQGLPTVDNHTNVIGVVMNWSLFDGGEHHRKAAALDATAHALEDQQRETEALIRLDVKRAHLALQSAHQQSRVAQSGVSLATEALKLTRSRYRNGLATQTEVLAAETRLADADRAVSDAQFDTLLAALRIKRALGVL